ncbi:hypothetical protein AWZ03_009776 [Drosophila navojoa]|uniref:Uncharacterized protein n=1 Tax=Drosophila navojoa TaxID=7232 RepID=A0A484B556_DRONA|nr:hypothetical protein AWZ03_009776 [Drosophila navojoa]
MASSALTGGAKCGDKEHQEADEEEAGLQQQQQAQQQQQQQRQQQGSETRKAIKKRAIERQTKAQSGIVVVRSSQSQA